MMSKGHGMLKGMASLWLSLVLLAVVASAAVASPPTQATTPTAVPQSGNIQNGKALFIGDVKLANGGPACISCHSIDNVGLLGGGALGPNLTQASVKYGQDGLAANLSDIQFRTMSVIFAGHPLTPTEVADLTAFITSAAGQPQVNKEGAILILSGAGFIAAMVIAALYWRGRLREVRRQLVDQVYNKGSKYPN